MHQGLFHDSFLAPESKSYITGVIYGLNIPTPSVYINNKWQINKKNLTFMLVKIKTLVKLCII